MNWQELQEFMSNQTYVFFKKQGRYFNCTWKYSGKSSRRTEISARLFHPTISILGGKTRRMDTRKLYIFCPRYQDHFRIEKPPPSRVFIA